eukprot:gene14132-44515_t
MRSFVAVALGALPAGWPQPAAGTVAETDALRQLYQAAQDANCNVPPFGTGPCWGQRANWGPPGTTGVDACTAGWYGVTCDATNNIIRLDLSNNNLRNPIGSQGIPPGVLSTLTKLQELQLDDNNNLRGSFPQELAAMP